MATNTRNRVIYQSEALYVGQPSATGCHVNASIDYDANGADTSARLFGLVKHPESIDELCIYDNTEDWTNISTPVDLDIDEWDAATAYNAGDIIKVTETTGSDTGAVWHFEASRDVSAGAKPITTLLAFTDNGTKDFSTRAATGSATDLGDWTLVWLLDSLTAYKAQTIVLLSTGKMLTNSDNFTGSIRLPSILQQCL